MDSRSGHDRRRTEGKGRNSTRARVRGRGEDRQWRGDKGDRDETESGSSRE